MVRKEFKNENLVIAFRNMEKLNVLNREIIKKELNESMTKKYKTVALDLDGIKFIDSSVFQTLLEYKNNLTTTGRKFYLVNVSEDVNELIRLLHLEKTLEYKKAA